VKRLAKDYLFQYAFDDDVLNEKVNRTPVSMLFDEFGCNPFDTVLGEVFEDSRGRGSFQR